MKEVKVITGITYHSMEDIYQLFNTGFNKIVENTIFRECNFLGVDLAQIIWINCTFENVRFDKCRIIGTYFNESRFVFTDFIKCYFEQGYRTLDLISYSVSSCTSSFKKCVMNYVNFIKCNNKDIKIVECSSEGIEFEGCNLTSCQILNNKFDTIKIFNSELHSTEFNYNNVGNAELVECVLNNKTTFIFIDNEENLKSNIHMLYQIYRFLKVQGYTSEAVDYYLKYRSYQRKASKGMSRIWLYSLHKLFGDGEELRKILAGALLTIFTFGLLYNITGIQVNVNSEMIKSGPKLIQCLYLSVLTFTTLGSGDISPSTPISMILCMIEVLIGVIYIAVLTAVFYKKISS